MKVTRLMPASDRQTPYPPRGQFLGLLRRALRPSVVARGLWLAVALLHAVLVLRRVASGEWSNTLDAIRGILCLGGVFYCSLKFWRIATILDSAPRRALAFALVLLLGHWLLVPPVGAEGPLGASGPLAAVAVLIVAPALGAAAILIRRATSAKAVLRRPHPYFEAPGAHPFSLAVSRRVFSLFRRPPPLPC